jgi:hypothetical protein
MLVVKALLPSFILTLVISAVVASSGTTAHFLNIHEAAIYGHTIHWSWPLFLAGSALGWVLLLMMR